MSEIDSSPENTRIPENWKFPERNETRLKLIQIEPEERFIAFQLPSTRLNSQFNREYFFDPEGNSREDRVYTKLHLEKYSKVLDPVENLITYIHLAGDREVDYEIPGDRESIVSGLGEVIVKMGLNRGEESDLTPLMNYVAAFAFKGGVLTEVWADKYFIEGVNSERKYIASPKLSIRRPVIREGVGNWKLDPRLKENQKGEFNLQPEYKENRATYFYNNGEKAFDIEYKADNDIFVVSQTHIPTGIVKTLRAPLSINLKELADATFVRPPYGKERVAGQDRLVVPWRNIGRIVGASLSYSYPPPTPQK